MSSLSHPPPSRWTCRLAARCGRRASRSAGWRPCPGARQAEATLAGQTITADTAQRAAEAAFTGAEPHKHNAFKIALGRQTLARALFETATMEV